MEEDYHYREAKRRVKRKKGFYRHLAVYLVVNTIFFFVVLLNEGSFGWLIPASFWGIGLAINYFSVFGLPGTERLGGTDWEDKEIRKEMDKIGSNYEKETPTHDELDLREIKKQKRNWDDSDLV